MGKGFGVIKMDAFAVSETMLAEQGKPDDNGNQSTNTEESNKFQRAISSWRGTNHADRQTQ